MPRRVKKANEPGSGGPKSDKEWRNAILLAVKENDFSGKKKLRKLAQKLVGLGLAGDVSALREIGDRLDGKAKQETEIGSIGGGKLEVTTEVVFVQPKT
jgi:hypothetical protein